MKKIIFPLVAFLLIISCSKKSPEEQMLTDFIDKWTIDVFKISSEDLNLKIEYLTNSGGITGKDSLAFYLNKHENSWYMKELDTNVPKDSLTVNAMSDKSKRIIDTYQGVLDDLPNKKEYSSLKNKYTAQLNQIKKMKNDIDLIKLKIDYYSQKEEVILSQKYATKYTIENPILQKTQTFERVYYTNKEGTQFVTYNNLK